LNGTIKSIIVGGNIYSILIWVYQRKKRYRRDKK